MSRGGNRDGAGRPKGSTKPDDLKIKPRKISLTDNEYKNYLKKGGAKWLRPVLRDE